MIRFLSLDAKTRNAFIRDIRKTWRKVNAEAVISFLEEMELPVISDFVESLSKIKGESDPHVKVLLAVLEALRSGKSKGSDWRLAPRTSRKQVSNASRRRN
jgi:hypothetical protein